ncbi:MAG: hypothetical protein QT11_C0001G1015 [archaeon GW2011_AR20]|nr:MAG: hypothetical protein QT11_C0001G1015 [archaeon GW2011_AR20]AQS33428.1 hypothetical protein [uncultured archaeon]AQS33508.1 hypothetical protein [uncultured archaeon]MBS3161015.1 nucleotidyltransferase domain-containing protein [Candidatus Woesearchaeota archaeon]
MLHNKYFQILEKFTGNYNREIYGRQLINKTNLSQKNIALVLQDLENLSILKSKVMGKMKFYSLNLSYQSIKDILIMIELIKKTEFLSKYIKLASIFKEDSRIVGIFGSYAKETQTKFSDLDVFIVGSKTKNDYEEKGKFFDVNVSIKYFKENEFLNLLKKKNNLIKEIIEDHIVLFNTEKFVNLIWRDYYGYS